MRRCTVCAAAATAERGDSGNAFRDYATALANDPENAPRYLLWRAQLHLDCDDFAAAEQDVSEVVAREPQNSEAYYTRGTVRQQRDDTAGGIEDFTESLRLKPDHAFAFLGRAICHLMRKDYAAAWPMPTASFS